jgi:hypothetical protein
MRKRIERKVPVSKMFMAMTVLRRFGAEEIETESYPTDETSTIISAVMPKSQIDHLPRYFEEVNSRGR